MTTELRRGNSRTVSGWARSSSVLRENGSWVEGRNTTMTLRHASRHLRGAAQSIATVVAALTCTVAFGLPAGAMGAHSFGPHGGSMAVAPSVRPHALAPLTLANIVVTDLASGNATVYSFTSVAPNNGCGNNQSFVCLSLAGDGAGSFDLTVASHFQSGAFYDDVTGSATISAGGASCGEVSNDGAASFFAVELDQYHSPAGAAPDVWASQFDCTNPVVDISGTIAMNIVPTNPASGYYLFGQAGEITGFGNDNYLAYLNGAQYYNLNAPIVGMAPTPSGRGYWFVASDGGIFAYGDAGFYGSRGGQPLNKPIVGMAATPDGRGYWLVASDGGIFSYGDAGFFGSTGAIHLNQPVVGMTPTPSGHGYWFVAADGGIFAYGDAGFYGSTGAIHLNSPIVGMLATPDGHGYWFTASDGGVFTYGSAGFAGSLGGSGVNDVAGMSLGI